MCGRLTVNNSSTLHSYYAGLGFSLKPRYNVAPTESLQLVYDGTVSEARWWLTPSWSDGPSQKYSMFNARCESLAGSAAFRRPFRCQRGVVPMSHFIEWRGSKGHKQPWSVSNESAALFAAALWDLWQPIEGSPLLSCAIVTTAAAPAFKAWHKRMPVLLTASEQRRWLDNRHEIASDDPLFRPALKCNWLVAPLDRAIGNSRNKAPALMEPVGEVVSLK